MVFNDATSQMLLERGGGAVHTVDGDDLFCRVKDLGVEPDSFGRTMLAKAELAHVNGATFARSCRHDVVVDGTTWSITGVREKLSGLVVWSMEREVG